MHRKNFTAVICTCILLFATLQLLQDAQLTKANPEPVTLVPPVVEVPEAQVNASISWENGDLWTKVDSEFLFHTIYAFGDQYQTPNYGMGLINSQDEITVMVAYNRLDAQFPVPLNATNLSVKMDAEETNWTFTSRINHLLDANLPELHWGITPVPSNFSITTHYEYTVPSTTEAYAYLGKHACLFPLSSRFGLEGAINYNGNEHPWLTNATCTKFNIRMNPFFTNLKAYSVYGFGTLTPINFTLTMNNSTPTMQFTLSKENILLGVVVLFDDPTTQYPTTTPTETVQVSPTASGEPTQTTDYSDGFAEFSWLIAAVVIAILVCSTVSALILVKRKRTRPLLNRN